MTCAHVPDSCASAAALDLSFGMAEVQGDTTYADDDTTLSCALPGSEGRDVVYVVSLATRSSFEAIAVPKPGSALKPVLQLRRVCNNADNALSLACAYATTNTSMTRLSIDSVDPGTYFLWLDSEGSEAGAYTLTVKLDPAAIGESCATPRTVLVADNPVELTGDTGPLTDDAFGTCGGQGAGDAVFRLENVAARRVRFEVSAVEGGWAPVVYLRSGACDDATRANQLGCALGTSGPAVLDIPRLEAGRSFVVVDGAAHMSAGAKAGKFRLRVVPLEAIGPPTNDGCSAAAALTLPLTGQVTAQGDTSNALNDALGCNGSGNDLVYSFDLPQARQVVVRAVALSGSSFRPSLYLRRSGKCDSEMLADQVGCAVGNVGGSATLSLPNLAAGTWYLWVDGASATSGPFDLVVETAAPVPSPANDTCVGMQSVSVASGPVTVNGTTLGAGDDTSSCQYPEGLFSPDVVYNVSVPTRRSLGIEVKALAGSSLRPVVTLRAPGQCDSTSMGTELYCGWNDSQFVDRVAFTLPDVPAGDYPVWVDGDVGSQGPFTLRLTPGPVISPPANDDCSSIAMAPALTLGNAVIGDTRGAAPTTQGMCAMPAGSNGEAAPDVVYKFVLTQAKSVVVTVTPDANDGQLFRPVVYVRGNFNASCADPQAVKGCSAATAYGSAATVSLPNLPAGTYFVWVDGAGLSSGKFSLKVQ